MANTIVKVIDLVPGKTCALKALSEDLREEDFWVDHVCAQAPVVVKNAAKNWLATKNWGIGGYLESLCEEELVFSFRTFNPMPTYPLSNSLKKRKLRECLQEMRDLSDDETYSIPAFSVPEKWCREIGEFSFFSAKYDHKPRVYPRERLFVYKNASTEWHYHPHDESLTVQLLGSKRISLFKLEQNNWHTYADVIGANFHHLPCAKSFFPIEPQITKFEAILEPGDCIYIPPFWWHGVEPADANFGVTLAHCFHSPMLGSDGKPDTGNPKYLSSI